MLIVKKTQQFYYEKIENFRLASLHKGHVVEMEKWAVAMANKFSQADKEVVFLAVWLHDIGLITNNLENDHSVIGEEIAREWLIKENYDKHKVAKVLHCVRTHRCKDVMPVTLEAKIIVFADSASHMTQGVYLDILKEQKEGRSYDALQKLERDWRDLSFFPEDKKDLLGLYKAWKALINAYKKVNI